MDKYHPSVVETIVSAAKDSPIFPLRQDTMDDISSTSETIGENKRLAAYLLVSTFTRFTYSYICLNIPEQKLLD